MARADLRVVGAQGSVPRRITTSGTAIEHGEPIYLDGVTWSNGAASANYFELMDADGVVVGTDVFGGIAIEKSENVAAGTTKAQYLNAACPVPHIGQIRGKAETVASVDTQTEVNGLYSDMLLVDYNSTGAADGGELYTIKVAPSADTSFGSLVWANVATQELGIVVDTFAYRFDRS